MAKYRKKPVIVDAVEWWSVGDHPAVSQYTKDYAFYNPVCDHCAFRMDAHGAVWTLESGSNNMHIVCPGDWIITGVKGEHYPCKPDIFEETYEKVKE